MSSEKRERTRAMFKKGQKCIVPHTEMDDETGEPKIVYYGALILRGEKRTDPESKESNYFYLVHYMGWNKEHDTWMEESELCKYDADLLTGVHTAATDEARRRAELSAEAKRARERLAEIPPHLRLRMPAMLKKVVLDDYDRVMHQGKVLPLPRTKFSRPCVREIIQEWRETRSEELLDSEDSEILIEQVEEIARGLLSYFNNALKQMLLYQPEVAGCTEALEGDTLLPADVYGAEHLLRLLVKLPEWLPVNMMAVAGDARNVVAVEENVQDLMVMMTDRKTQAKLFSISEEYVQNPHWTPPLLGQGASLPQPTSAVKKEVQESVPAAETNDNTAEGNGGSQPKSEAEEQQEQQQEPMDVL